MTGVDDAAFGDAGLLREALEKVARHGTDPELSELARRAVERVAASSELRDLGDDDARIEAAVSRSRET